METLEGLKAMAEKAEAGNYTQVSLNGDSFYKSDGFGGWVVYDGDEAEFAEYELPATRSLSDIKEIIKLREDLIEVTKEITRLRKYPY